jgi:hypothetical protein
VAVEVGADGAGALADLRGLGAEFGVVDHFLDVAEAVGPVAEVVAGERAAFVPAGALAVAGESAEVVLLDGLATAPRAATPGAGLGAPARKRLLAELALLALAGLLLLAGLVGVGGLLFALLLLTGLAFAGLLTALTLTAGLALLTALTLLSLLTGLLALLSLLPLLPLLTLLPLLALLPLLLAALTLLSAFALLALALAGLRLLSPLALLPLWPLLSLLIAGLLAILLLLLLTFAGSLTGLALAALLLLASGLTLSTLTVLLLIATILHPLFDGLLSIAGLLPLTGVCAAGLGRGIPASALPPLLRRLLVPAQAALLLPLARLGVAGLLLAVATVLRIGLTVGLLLLLPLLPLLAVLTARRVQGQLVRGRIGRRAAGIGPQRAGLALEFLGERVELIAGAAEGFGLVAQHALGGALDALAELGDPLAGLGLGPAGFLDEALLEQLFAGVEGLVGLLLAGLADRVVELLGQQRFGGLGLLDGLPHVLQ